MNKLLKDLNKKGWFLLFSWQMSDNSLCMIFRRVEMPEFVVFGMGKDENRVLGELSVKASWMDGFIKKHDLEAKYAEFADDKNKTIKYIKNKMNV